MRATALDELKNGRDVPGFKVVAGRAGNRKWSNAAEVEATLKSMGLNNDEMYEKSLITPTTAEKLAKARVIGPRQWPKLKDMIVRGDGKPTVVKADDPRPALTVASPDDFSNESSDLV